MTQDASFENFRAVGGFLVSATLVRGIIEDVQIFSESGKDCVVGLPSDVKTIGVTSVNGDVIVEAMGEYWMFQTKSNVLYKVSIKY